MNCLLILCASALAFFSLSGVSARALTDARCASEAALLSLRALFTRWGAPFRMLSALRRGEGRGRLTGVLVGALCALPVLLLCGSLLASADAVFSGVFDAAAEWLLGIDALSALFRALDTLFYALCFFSALYFVTTQPPEPAGEAPGARGARPPRPMSPPLTLLCALYALFAACSSSISAAGRRRRPWRAAGPSTPAAASASWCW